MPLRRSAPLTPVGTSTILTEALRRIRADIAGPVDLHALRRALETEQAKGPHTLAELVKVGRRRAIDRLSRAERKAVARGS